MSATLPLVSVVVPVYNSLETIEEALSSVFHQTYDNLELIVVNDGSYDGSAEYLKTVSSPRPFTVIDQENTGAGAARNRGLQAARGEFVLFQDSDVILRLTIIDEMVDALRTDPDAAYAYCDFETRMDAVSWRPRFTRGMSFDPVALRKFNYISAISMVRRELCLEWDTSLRALEDWNLWLSMWDLGLRGVHIPRVLFETIDRASSITQTWDKNHHTEARERVLSKHQRVALLAIGSCGLETVEELARQGGVFPSPWCAFLALTDVDGSPSVSRLRVDLEGALGHAVEDDSEDQGIRVALNNYAPDADFFLVMGDGQTLSADNLRAMLLAGTYSNSHLVLSAADGSSEAWFHTSILGMRVGITREGATPLLVPADLVAAACHALESSSAFIEALFSAAREAGALVGNLQPRQEGVTVAAVRSADEGAS